MTTTRSRTAGLVSDRIQNALHAIAREALDAAASDRDMVHRLRIVS